MSFDIFNGLIQVPSFAPFKQNTTSALTGTTAETLITSFLIPANTFQANDWLESVLHILTNSSSNAKTVRLYFNTSASLSGATLWSTRTLSQTTSQGFKRNLIFQNSISSQRTISNRALDPDDAPTIGASSVLSINFAVDQYFIISGQLAVGTDNITVAGITSLIRR